LLPLETKIVVDLYLETSNWDDVKLKVIEDDVLQKPTLKTRKTVLGEIKKRVLHLTPLEMQHFHDASMDDIRVLSFVSCLKTYRLIYEFVIEVMREKYLLFDYEIQNSDYSSFYESKSIASEKLATVSESTQKKLKQVMISMLVDVGLIESKKNLYITKPLLSDAVIHILLADSPKLLSALLVSHDDIAYYTRGNDENREP